MRKGDLDGVNAVTSETKKGAMLAASPPSELDEVTQ